MGVDPIEVPDWNRVVTLLGQQSDGTPQIVQLDGAGRIVAVIQGEIEGIVGAVTVEPGTAPLDVSGTLDGVTNPVTVDQSDSVRQVQGTDGSTLRTVKLDANGQIIMVPRGQSGNYMSVDASGFLTSVMKGDYTGTPTTLAVDSSGNIVAVIKGEYSGALKTVATDADGRMIMIPTDPADVWGNAIGAGNSEVIAALTPAKRYDKRGSVVFWDSFEDGLAGWFTQVSAGGGVVALSAVRAQHAAYSARLTAAGEYSQFARIMKGMPRNVDSAVGLECSFCWEDDIDYIMLGIYWTDGEKAYTAQIRWEAAGESLEYMGVAGSWTDFDADKPLYVNIRYWHVFKVVVDTVTGEYVRAFCDDEVYDLSDIVVYSVPSAINPALWVDIWADGFEGKSVDVWVDGVVFTQNEPT